MTACAVRRATVASLSLSVIAVTLLASGCRGGRPEGAAAEPRTAEQAAATSGGAHPKAAECEKGDVAACAEAGAALAKGEGVAENLPLAVSYLKKACEGDEAKGCLDLGTLQLMNAEVKNVVEGITAIRRACDLKHGDACFLLGTMAEGLIQIASLPPDPKLAKAYYRKACGYGNEVGCTAAKQD